MYENLELTKGNIFFVNILSSEEESFVTFEKETKLAKEREYF
jgi:hypothetical protein